MTDERRLFRSDVRHRALAILLDGAREKEHAMAVALTTAEGLYVAGAGAAEDELERMGAMGAAQRTHWNEVPLFVRSVQVGDQQLALTGVGGRFEGADLDEGIRRILFS